MIEQISPSYERESIERKPEFDGGIFTIEYLSPEGFEVKTRESLLRHAPNTPLPEARRIKTERDKEPERFRVGPDFSPLVGVRNIKRVGNTLIIDIKPVTFPAYKAIGSSNETPESLEVSNPSATALILMTTEADGSHKMLVQHRSERNFFYGDIPGASVAGILDGKLDKSREKRGRLLPIDTADIIKNIQKEMIEEIGVENDEMTDCRIVGFARDKTRIHDEFLLLGTASLSEKAIAERTGRGDKFGAGEKIFTIDGAPESIETLLTKIKCPLPSTHVAAFVAAGYSMVLERDGQRAADIWKEKMEEKVKRNYQEINQTVAQYYKTYPEILSQQPEGKPARNPNGYEPAYLPQEQGLPNLSEELRRVGLVN